MSRYQDDLPPSSRYRRRRPLRVVSWFGLMMGLAIGIGLGLFFTWYVSPVVEVDTAPSQLSIEAQAEYMVAIALSFAYNSDLEKATDRLLTVLSPDDPFQDVAEAACFLARSGYVNSSSGLRAIRNMKTFYQLQGKSSCADQLVQLDAPQPTEIVIELTPPTQAPPATKTPTPEATKAATPTPVPIIVPTSPPQQQYVLVNVSTFCSVELSGIIEVYVQDFNGEGIPGQPVRVRWDSGEDTFYTGLKPERGAAYADFVMEPDTGYTIEMPGRSDPSSQALVAVPCNTEAGERALTSYRVVFRPSN